MMAQKHCWCDPPLSPMPLAWPALTEFEMFQDRVKLSQNKVEDLIDQLGNQKCKYGIMGFLTCTFVLLLLAVIYF